jgi:hypothetical protein
MGKTKGTALIGLVRTLRSNRARALELLPADLHHYLDQRILVGSWYPDQDVQRVLRAFIQLMGGSMGWERAGVLLARKDLSTVYANILAGRSVEAVLTHISGLWDNYHDTGTERATFSPGKCRIELQDFSIRSGDYCRLVGAYNGELIERAGGRVENMRKVSCTSVGDPTCIWEYDWSPASGEAPSQ